MNDAPMFQPVTKSIGFRSLRVCGVCLLAASVFFGWPAPAESLPAFSSLPEARLDPAFTGYFRQTNHWAAGDGAVSIPLSDGRVLWLFGDSYVNQFDPASGTLPALFNARNAVLVQRTNDLGNLQTLGRLGRTDKSFFRPPGSKTNFWPCFWPGAGFQSGNVIHVYLNEIQKTPAGGLWGFKTIGYYLATLSFPDLKVTGYVKLPDMAGIFFGDGFVKDEKSGLVYAFGSKLHSIGSDVFVARFPAANPEEAWTFWDGQDWNTNAARAAVITQGASSSVSVCRVANRYLLVTSAFSVACDQGRAIFAAVSDSPVGPFTPRKRIFTVDDAVQGHHPFFYLPVIHPEFINGDGLLITYCINGYEPAVPNCVNGRMNPDYYRPRAIRLPLN